MTLFEECVMALVNMFIFWKGTHNQSMNIEMNKHKEDFLHVWYRFDIGIPGEAYIDEHGRKRSTIKTIYGVFRFNKKNMSLEFEEDQTDPYFLRNPTPYKNGCWSRMLACQKKNYYPDKECYACG